MFAFELSPNNLSNPGFTIDTLVQCIESGIECIRLDLEFNYELHSDISIADLPTITNYSSTNSKVFIRIEGSVFQPIVNGVVKAHVDVINPGSPEARQPRFARASMAYKLLINDHHKYGLPSEMDLFWSNRQRRILIADRKTEKVLQKSLWRWLQNNVSDGRVVGEVQKLSPERTDIEIQSFRGNKCYIIEIKWLGKNAANGEYDETRIKQGVDQIKNYLLTDNYVTKAILVCYDGRSEYQYSNNSVINPDDKDIRGDYFVLFLPSDAASDHGGSTS